MTRRLLLALCCALAGVGATGARACQLTMGWEPWAPYQYIGDDGDVTGLDVELIGGALAQANCELRLRQTTWRRGLADAERGGLDLVAAAGLTEARRQWAYFSDSYRNDEQVLYVAAGAIDRYPFTSLADIIGTNFRLGVGRGVYYGGEFERLSADDAFLRHVYPIDTEAQKYQILLAGRVDGFLANPISMSHLLRLGQAQQRLAVHPLTVHASKLYLIFSKKSTTPELAERFNAGLRVLKASGEYDKILERYLNN